MDTAKDDRIYSSTRILSAGIIVILLLAFFALYLQPDHTDTNFAWTTLPRTSAILIGGGYTAGAFYFARLLGQKKWHRVQAGFLPLAAFTICMLAATLLHWSRFNQSVPAFYIWIIVYALAPFIVPLVWWRNQATMSSDLEENDIRFSSFVRWGMGIVAAIGILSFLIIFMRPSILISLAPWKLTELTARVFAGWSLLTFATVLSIANDGRWSATRILLESAMVGLVLTLLSLPRMWIDFDQTNPMTYIFVATTILTLVAFIIIHFWLDRSSRQKG